jgi:hypothetical protein
MAPRAARGKRLTRTAAVLVVIALLAGGVVPLSRASPAQPRAVKALAFESLGDFGGSYTGVVVEGQLAFASRGARLQVLDVTDPAAPVEAGLSDALPAPAAVAAVGQGRAYLVERVRTAAENDQHDVLHVVDVSHPSAPRVRGSLRLPKDTLGTVAVDGDVAYCASGKAAITVVDVTDAGMPALLAVAELGMAVHDLEMYRGYLLAAVAGGPAGDGLLVLDLADPGAPRVAGRLEAGSARHVEVLGDTALLEGGGRLTSIDLADPTSPRILGVVDVPDRASRRGVAALAVTPQQAFALEAPRAVRDTWRLHVVDVSDPGAMTLLGTQAAWGGAIAAAGDMVLAANGAIGLRTLAAAQMGSGSPIAEMHRVPTIGNPTGVAIAGDHAYAVDSDTELWVLDISDPAAPVAVGRTEFVAPHLGALDNAWSGAITVADGHAYALRRAGHFQTGGLHVFDVRDPAGPRQVGVWDPWLAQRDDPEFPEMWDLQPWSAPVLEGDRIWVSGNPWLVGLDVVDPAAPRYGTHYHPPPGMRLDAWNAMGVQVKGATAWLAALEDGVVAVDLSDPRKPTLAARADLPGSAQDVAEHAGYLLAGLGEGGLRVLDAVTLAPVRELRDASAYRITVAGSTAFLAGWVTGLTAVDVSDPALPVVQGAYPDWVATEDSQIAVRADVVALTYGDRGLRLLRMHEAEALPEPTLGPTLTPWPTRTPGTEPPRITPLPTGTPAHTSTPAMSATAVPLGGRAYLPAALLREPPVLPPAW